ncbi:MAG: hypothetical protein ACTSYJ_08045 [Candidatus Thorarchaeota archaeon]
MPVHIEQFKETQEVFPTLKAVAQKDDFVFAATIVMEGIVGQGNKTRLPYHLFVDLMNFPNIMPDCFVLSPADADIKHVNVFYPKLCPKLNKELPFFCIGNIGLVLQKYRHLMAFLQGMKRIVNSETIGPRTPQ